MKKLLAMVLALVMTLSLAVSANAFKDDKSISDDYAESVAVLNGMGVFKGYEDGSFKPEGNITRAEVATIVYRIYTADVAKNDKSGLYATYNKFSDMAGASSPFTTRGARRSARRWPRRCSKSGRRARRARAAPFRSGFRVSSALSARIFRSGFWVVHRCCCTCFSSSFCAARAFARTVYSYKAVKRFLGTNRCSGGKIFRLDNAGKRGIMEIEKGAATSG